jgi:hypothetical protein
VAHYFSFKSFLLKAQPYQVLRSFGQLLVTQANWWPVIDLHTQR